MKRTVMMVVLAGWAALSAPAALGAEADAVRERIEAWCAAFTRGDLEAFLDAYHPAFHAGGMDLDGWRKMTADRFRRNPGASLRVDGLSIGVDGDTARARLLQRLRTDGATQAIDTTLDLEKWQGRWQIISEVGHPHSPDAPASERTAFPEGADAPAAVGMPTLTGEGGLDRFSLPVRPLSAVRIFTMEGKPARVVIDVAGVKSWDGKPLMPLGGRWVGRVRSYLHAAESRLRLVLDLEPAGEYRIEEMRFPDADLLVLDISGS